MPPMRSKSAVGLSRYSCHRYEIIMGTNKSPDKSDKVYRSTVHASTMLQNLNVLRQNSKFCDVEIVAGETVIKVLFLLASIND